MLVSINSVSIAYILAIVFGLYVGISETVQRAVIPKYVSSEMRGTAYGFYSLVSGVCLFVSNITFGFIWDSYGIIMAVIFSITLTIASIAGMIVFIKKYSK
jgi:MFS-type transporter involved in bile tolerance (Atg22 family)